MIKLGIGINLERTLLGGQAFRWRYQPDTDSYAGAASGRAARVKREAGGIVLTGDDETFWRNYFDANRDYDCILDSIRRDNIVNQAYKSYGVIRILRQDKFETLISFIISACNNIGRISGIIERMCEALGDEIESCGNDSHSSYSSHSFPDAKILADESQGLEVLRAGFRAKYIRSAAQIVAGGLSLESLDCLTDETLKQALMKFPGVGAKVAGCVMLFAYSRMSAFPRDVWVNRALDEFYPGGLPECFTGYEGIAQQYIFEYIRNRKR